jgi:endonuclease-8
MPEGDTIHRIASALRERLLGRTVRRLYLRERGELRELHGREVRRVEAHGKHLTIELGGEVGLRVHLGMKGRLRSYPATAAPTSPALPLVIATTEDAFAFPRASQVELFRGRPERQPAIARLGPDLLDPDADPDAQLDTIVTRARAPRCFGRPLGELLLDQSVAAGIGNVYKSEVLFVQRLDPFAPAGSLSEADLHALYARARELLRDNLRPGYRQTVKREDLRSARPQDQPGAPGPPGSRLWVYGRSGEPCLQCRTPIRMRRQGHAARSTYYCPKCQQH